LFIHRKVCCGLLWVLLLFVSPLVAQEGVKHTYSPTLRSRNLIIQGDSLIVDSLPIVPGTLFIKGIAPQTYKFDPFRSILVWQQRPKLDTVEVQYRVFNTSLLVPVQGLRFDSVSKKFNLPAKTLADKTTSSTWNFSGLQAQGSLGRQLGFGNKQDAVVNSTLNLQLNGWLPDSIRFTAAIADQQLPVQPDGSTRQLQEFDQILLQFQKKNWQLQLGDIDLRADQDYFLRFYKRMQGIGFQTKQQLGKKIQGSTTVNGAVAKGKFIRQQLDTKEGNQGPYRLQGPANEFFLVILANSERVFYDGVLLQRGEDQDYVINYNTAEIRFTPKRMISKDSRVQVEFEYAERNYLNSNLYLSQHVEIGNRWQFRISAFQNTDARNATLNQQLDAAQKSFLAAIGDSIQKAYYSSAILDTSGRNSILYEKVVSASDSFYRYSTNRTTPRYAVAFTDMGAGKGDYIPDLAVANGKVYQYVAPVNGIKQGRFEPVLLLVTPKQQQVVTASVSYTISNKTVFTTEIATSKRDLNRFSSINKGDDRGWALKTGWSQHVTSNLARSKSLQLNLSHEYVNKRFNPLERLRDVEFSRDWGLSLQTAITSSVTENILKGGISWRHPQKGGWELRSTHYQRSDRYKGWQHLLKQYERVRNWQFNNQLLITHFSLPGIGGSFFRPSFDISAPLPGKKGYRIGASYALENNTVREEVSKILQPQSFYFDQVAFFIRSQEELFNKFQFRFFSRGDYAAQGTAWKKADRSFNWQAEAELLKSTSQQLLVNATLRKLKVINPQFSSANNDWTLLSRLQYRLRKWKGFLDGNLLYELGSGQEQRRDVVFVEVPAGQGEYAWVDYNQDGVQQLNEFEWAQFPDQAKFVKLFTPTNDFIKADQLTFNYQLSLTPRLLLSQFPSRSWQSFVARFTWNSSWQHQRKTFANRKLSWNPFEQNIPDSALVMMQGILSNAISFNRFSTRWGLDLSHYLTETKAVLSYGFEQRTQEDWLLKLRVNWSRHLSNIVEFKKGQLELYTPAFANRNYSISEVKIKPQLQWIRGTAILINGSFQYQERRNSPLFGGEHSIAKVWMTEMRYNRLQKGALSARVSLHQIEYAHALKNTVSYIMLDGLVPGINWVWMCSYQKRISQRLELNLQYDGRKSGTSSTVHMGRAGVTALF
jgi:hypothetical protein